MHILWDVLAAGGKYCSLLYDKLGRAVYLYRKKIPCVILHFIIIKINYRSLNKQVKKMMGEIKWSKI